MVKRVVILCLVLSFALSVFAWSPFPSLGGQRVGTSVFTFLGIGVGARGTSMGGAFIAVGTGGEALYWNPGGMVRADGVEVFSTYTMWAVGMNYGYCVYAFPSFGGKIGVVAGYLGSGAMDCLLYTSPSPRD